MEFSIHTDRREPRKSVGQPTRWRSLPAAIRTKRQPRYGVAALRPRSGVGLRRSQHAGSAMESQPPKTDRHRSAVIGELSRKPHRSSLVHATLKPFGLYSGRSMHDKRSGVQPLLFDRQYGSAAPAGAGESGSRKILWRSAKSRRRRYKQL